MGIDLKVMASCFRERRDEFLPTATLRFDRDDGIFSQLTLEASPCLVRQLPQGLKVGCYEDSGLAFTTCVSCTCQVTLPPGTVLSWHSF